MASNVFRFEESWSIPHATPEEVWEVLARGELLPRWWKGVYLQAHSLDGSEPHVGGRVRARARGFLPYHLNFILEATDLIPGQVVAVKTSGDFEGRWRAELSPRDGGTHADLTWEVSVERPILRILAPVAAGIRLEPSLDDAARRAWFEGISCGPAQGETTS